MHKGLIITVAVLAALVIGVISVFNFASNLQQSGVAQETALNAQYLANQNELSTYISKFYETIGVANLKSDKMDQIITDAVKGRYQGNSSAQPGRGQLFSAISEAYPNADLSIYDRIIDQINSGREAYKAKQDKLVDMLRGYDQWRKSGLIQPIIIRTIGFPSDALEARIGTDVKRGSAAEEQMWLIVTTTSTSQAYQTGHQDPLQVPGGKPTSK